MKGRRQIMFAYWGQRGFARFVLDFAKAAAAKLTTENFSISVSRSNELFDEFAPLGDAVYPVHTFSARPYAAFNLARILRFNSELKARITADGTRVFVSLMSHVWSPLCVPVLRRFGLRHVVVVHDAEAHPGDHTTVVNSWLLREARSADRVITLSNFTTEGLLKTHSFPREKVVTLFHPDFGTRLQRPARAPGDPLRVLLFGRLSRYKGLDLAIGAVELLQGEGIAVKLGVYGSGNIDKFGPRLRAVGADVKNCWIDDSKVDNIIAQHDIVFASHIQASQSGVIARAYGSGVPVIATPVGGLNEQVIPGVTGVLARSATPEAFAAALRPLAQRRSALERLNSGVVETHASRSLDRFLDELVAVALGR